jgi:cytochrome c-type biogenesis protein CcmH/NrfG
MSARIGVAIMAAVLVLYILLAGQWAWLLLTSGDLLAVSMGAALVVLPAIGLWAVAREIWFGVRAERLGRTLEHEGGLPDDEVLVRPSGRVIRSEGEAVFPRYRAEAEAHPDDWRAWYRLGLAYDAAGDRKRAREAIRTAIRLDSSAARP